jgi:hypothetical protein
MYLRFAPYLRVTPSVAVACFLTVVLVVVLLLGVADVIRPSEMLCVVLGIVVGFGWLWVATGWRLESRLERERIAESDPKIDQLIVEQLIRELQG